MKLLDRDFTPQLDIHRTVDRRETARANLFENFVTRIERHDLSPWESSK